MSVLQYKTPNHAMSVTRVMPEKRRIEFWSQYSLFEIIVVSASCVYSEQYKQLHDAIAALWPWRYHSPCLSLFSAVCRLCPRAGDDEELQDIISEVVDGIHVERENEFATLGSVPKGKVQPSVEVAEDPNADLERRLAALTGGAWRGMVFL